MASPVLPLSKVVLLGSMFLSCTWLDMTLEILLLELMLAMSMSLSDRLVTDARWLILESGDADWLMWESGNAGRLMLESGNAGWLMSESGNAGWLMSESGNAGWSVLEFDSWFIPPYAPVAMIVPVGSVE